MSGLTLVIASVAGDRATYYIHNERNVVIRWGEQRIHRTRGDAKPRKQRKGRK